MTQAALIAELKRIVEDCTTQFDGKPFPTYEGSIIELAITEIESLTRNAEVCVFREIAPLLGIEQKVGFIEQTKERIRGLEAGLAKLEAALAQARGKQVRPTPGTVEYDDETDLMQEAADAMRHRPLVEPKQAGGVVKCIDCDWTFGCWQGKEPCRKPGSPKEQAGGKVGV